MSVDGKWWNELGSWMELHVESDGQTVTGTYHTAVGKASGVYKLVGRIDSAPNSGEGQGLGWVVSWQNDQSPGHSVTTWCGQYRVLEDGEEVIVTTWLLTSEGEADQEWESTLVSKDDFHRNQPSPQQIASVRARRGLPKVK